MMQQTIVLIVNRCSISLLHYKGDRTMIRQIAAIIVHKFIGAALSCILIFVLLSCSESEPKKALVPMKHIEVISEGLTTNGGLKIQFKVTTQVA